jgi:pimeloyl-ACP methyl ester carboxylesterase
MQTPSAAAGGRTALDTAWVERHGAGEPEAVATGRTAATLVRRAWSFRVRRWLLVIAGVVVLLLAGYAAVSAAAWDRVTATDGGCVASRAGQTPANFEARYRVDEPPVLDATPYRFEAEDVTFESLTTGIQLRAWYAPPARSDGPVVVVVHGRNSCRRNAVSLLPAGMLHRHGFGVLVVDLRDHGESDTYDGHWSGGVDEWQDVLGAWRWLRSNGVAAERIGLFGGSMGAGAVAYATAYEPEVAAAFLDSPYANILEAVTFYADAHDEPAYLVPGALVMGQVISGVPLLGESPADLFRAGRLAGRPLFIVHGDQDGTIDVSQGRALAEAATDGGSPVDPWIVAGAEHVQSAFLVTDEYERRLVDFFTDALGTP